MLNRCAAPSIRFMNPLNAAPGPSSMKRVKPCASNERIEASQRTDEVTCATSVVRIRSGHDFSQVTTKQIKKVQDILNSRPRKCLGFKSSLEVERSRSRVLR